MFKMFCWLLLWWLTYSEIHQMGQHFKKKSLFWRKSHISPCSPAWCHFCLVDMLSLCRSEFFPLCPSGAVKMVSSTPEVSSHFAKVVCEACLKKNSCLKVCFSCKTHFVYLPFWLPLWIKPAMSGFLSPSAKSWLAIQDFLFAKCLFVV